MSFDLAVWWRSISEYLPRWAKITFFASVAIGEGVRNLAIMLHPPVDYQVLNLWAWTIFGMFIAFPVAGLWRLVFRGRGAYEKAEEYIQIIKLAMKEAKLSKIEQAFQWRAVFAKLAGEFRVGASPPTSASFFSAHAVVEHPNPPDITD